ncbi:hypothetical protein [Natranaeroarchaeum aerophilus]|uniref:Uncharacterized protein n=1 Tax=Natranaeroarchaeum aerophilus TaxID=2917711 RepID=A0AAE3FNM2_9EURY|nr:hypothetical protein [Natranaeroarchaeum aerophilus]MCL9812043.1 hypothetical protein [Natranaeroarchaeum aerophilus]
MKAVITGETEDLVGVNLRDNYGAEHILDVRKKDGKITAHQCEAYADNPANRTTAENAYNEQAREFARFYVYRERGYKTLPPQRNPDRIAAAMFAVASLPPATIEQYFGDLHQQLQSHENAADPILSIPSTVDRDLLRAGQDLYLHHDESLIAGMEALTRTAAYEELEAATGADAEPMSIAELQGVLAELDVDLGEAAEHVGETLIETTGPVTIRWEKSRDNDEVQAADTDQPVPSREPDVRPDMIAEMFALESVDEFQEALVHHLRCQVRDCYVEMGVAPPELFRVTGPGFYKNIGWYAHHDFYPRYYNYHADIDDWQDENALDDLTA